jgi:hypothetical protein
MTLGKIFSKIISGLNEKYEPESMIKMADTILLMISTATKLKFGNAVQPLGWAFFYLRA